MTGIGTLVIEPRKAWPLVATRGALAVIFGILTLVWPQVTLLVLAVLYGVYALFDGVGSLMQAFRGGDTMHRASYALLGLLDIAVGVIVLVWPGLTVLVLALLVGIWAIVTGIAEISAAIRLRRQITGEAFLILAGAISVIAGILIVFNPIAGAFGVALLIGIYAVLYGIVLLVLAFRLRKVAGTVSITA